MTKVAAIQMASGPVTGANLLEAGRLIGSAVNAGAKLIVLPENFANMPINDRDLLNIKEQTGTGPIQEFLANEAQKHGVWLVGGTVPLACANPDKERIACMLYNDKGKPVARYDKIHLFDVHILDSDEHYTESASIEPGTDICVFDTPFGRLGLAICYDLRFPELFRVMLDQQVDLFAVPSAFTAITGKAHWETLIRARAIENLSYVIAGAQGGFHMSGRETFGDSMIVDPWGVVLDRLPSGSGFVIADYDQSRTAKTRKQFPVLSHRRVHCAD